MKNYTLKPITSSADYKVNYQQELNPAQLEVVMAGDGPLLVIAGAGSGKTRVVTYRVARLIESGINPASILLVTFTNKAAAEMLHRVERLIQQDMRRLWGGTFHHIGHMILRSQAKVLGYTNTFTILDRHDSEDLLATCITDLKIDHKDKRFPKPKVLATLISLSQNTYQTIPDLLFSRYPLFLEQQDQILSLASHYQAKKKKLNLMDFDDLLLNWKRLVEENQELADFYQRKFQYILVDEYQDTNCIQGEIIDLMAAGYGNLMVVGDDSQSIYSFRGADFANIMEFPKRYPQAKLYKLETNYRSTPEILHLANTAISQNKRQFTKTLAALRPAHMKPALVASRDVYQQAEFVAQRLLELRDEGYTLGDMAVLYRSHYHSMELQMELTRRNIPYEVRSGLRFFEQKHIKDVLSYLKIVSNSYDEVAWKRVLKLLPRVGNATADKVWQAVQKEADPVMAATGGKLDKIIPGPARSWWVKFLGTLGQITLPKQSPAEKIALVVTSGYDEYLQANLSNYTSRLEDLKQLANFARQYRSTKNFLGEMALLSDLTAEYTQGVPDKEDDGRVKLSSIHQAKGLEWRVVFIIWLVDGRFPSSKSLDDQEGAGGEEEERRLFYVAATRAKDELYLCYPLLDRYRGGGYGDVLLQPSRFVLELNQSMGELPYESWQVEVEDKPAVPHSSN